MMPSWWIGDALMPLHESRIPAMIGFYDTFHISRPHEGDLLIVPGVLDDHLVTTVAVHPEINAFNRFLKNTC
jgi:hypothetical protein